MEPPSRDPRPRYQRAHTWALASAVLGALAALAAVAAASLRSRPFRVEVAGPSMAPTLEAGDWLLATSPGRLRRGHVVVVEHPEHPGFEIVKRVVGVPGDLAPDGRTLGPDEFWVEGDDATASTDSRQFGALGRRHVVGRARLIYWPRERMRLL